MNKLSKISSILRFENIQRFSEPFTHFNVQEVLSHEEADRILTWLETTDMFIPRKEQFYRSSAFHLSPENTPNEVADFFSIENLSAIKVKVEDIFGVKFEDRFTISANKYLPGQGTLIHTDYVKPGFRDQFFFTHRFLLYLNRGWKEKDGGSLGIFNTPNPEDLSKVIHPIHNTGVGLAINQKSYHAVEAVHSGERYTLNFTFLSVSGEHQI
ncbi:cyclophane-containing peptide 2OG-Fe(II) oxygenase YhhC [Ectobacillus antri]|uniref:cyclophane-containing peptide 2OG-Fe(II) oxygenase YhhC n=1 Tax=Ectobacillus antri TaxID=2486280 RepID=UPI000F59C5AE|nr:cyclophane-containing peptide 2OG-Fe(II) oxygenase YhhC [Ectobacillus antri]